MDNENTWIRHSLFFSIFSFLSKPEIYEESFFYKAMIVISQAVSGCVKGSFLRIFLTNKPWEKTAVKRSRIMSAIFKINPWINKVIDFVNVSICNSFPYLSVATFEKKIIESPLVTFAYIFLPGVFANTLVKIAWSGFGKRSMVLRMGIMILIFALAQIKISLFDILSGSNICNIISRILGKNLKDFNTPAVKENQTFLSQEKMALIIPGFVLGIMYYFFSKITIVKLIGLVFLAPFIYLHPGAGIALAVFMLPLTATFYTVGVIGLTFLSVILNKNHLKLDVPTAVVPATFFMVIAVLAAVFSLMRAESISTLPLYVAYFMLFFSASILFKDQEILRKTITFQLISAVILSLYGIYQYFFVKAPTAIAWVDLEQFPELSTRVYATLENPNVLAEYLGLLIPMVLGLLWVSKGFRRKTILFITFCLMTACLILTFSRGAWVGLALAFLIFATLKEPRLFIILLLIVLVAPMFMPSVVTHRIESIGSLEDSSNTYRITIWIASLRMIKDYWLTGVGLGLSAFSRVYRDYMIAGTPAVHSHNLYLQIGIEMGILGLLALLWMVIQGFSTAISGLKNPHWSSFVQAGIVSALTGHLLHGLFDYTWFSPRILMTFWLLFGMMSAISSDTTANVKTGE